MKRTTLIIIGLIMVAFIGVAGAIALMLLHHPAQEWGWVLFIAGVATLLSTEIK